MPLTFRQYIDRHFSLRARNWQKNEDKEEVENKNVNITFISLFLWKNTALHVPLSDFL